MLQQRDPRKQGGNSTSQQQPLSFSVQTRGIIQAERDPLLKGDEDNDEHMNGSGRNKKLDFFREKAKCDHRMKEHEGERRGSPLIGGSNNCRQNNRDQQTHLGRRAPCKAKTSRAHIETTIKQNKHQLTSGRNGIKNLSGELCKKSKE